MKNIIIIFLFLPMFTAAQTSPSPDQAMPSNGGCVEDGFLFSGGGESKPVLPKVPIQVNTRAKLQSVGYNGLLITNLDYVTFELSCSSGKISLVSYNQLYPIVTTVLRYQNSELLVSDDKENWHKPLQVNPDVSFGLTLVSQLKPKGFLITGQVIEFEKVNLTLKDLSSLLKIVQAHYGTQVVVNIYLNRSCSLLTKNQKIPF